jgi:hypothetical protein
METKPQPVKKRRLLTVTLKDIGFAPGILQPVSVITPENHKGVVMELEPGYVLVTHHDRQVGIPLGNIKGWIFEQ